VDRRKRNGEECRNRAKNDDFHTCLALRMTAFMKSSERLAKVALKHSSGALRIYKDTIAGLAKVRLSPTRFVDLRNVGNPSAFEIECLTQRIRRRVTYSSHRTACDYSQQA
jgi:hypothetical protein